MPTCRTKATGGTPSACACSLLSRTSTAKRIVDTNCSIEGIDYPIPGNDDATRAIKLYCKLISDSVLDGLQESLGSEEDLGAQAEPEALAQQGGEASEEEAKPAAEEKKAAKKKVASSTKKEAFAKEAKKAASKKDEAQPEEAA